MYNEKKYLSGTTRTTYHGNFCRGLMEIPDTYLFFFGYHSSIVINLAPGLIIILHPGLVNLLIYYLQLPSFVQ